MIDACLPVSAFYTDRCDGLSQAPYDSLNLADHVGDDPSAVAMNRATVEDKAGAPVVFMRPDHGIQVARLDESYLAGGVPPVADVLVTTVPGIALGVLSADCVPLLIHDAKSGAIVAAHVGREGLYQGAVDAAVSALVDIRGGWDESEAITASVGPAICGHCYEVPTSVQHQLAERHPVARCTTTWGTPGLHIPRAVEVRLLQLGLVKTVRHHQCTFEDLRMYSYRREGTTGRFAGVIVNPAS